MRAVSAHTHTVPVAMMVTRLSHCRQNAWSRSAGPGAVARAAVAVWKASRHSPAASVHRDIGSPGWVGTWVSQYQPSKRTLNSPDRESGWTTVDTVRTTTPNSAHGENRAPAGREQVHTSRWARKITAVS